MLNRKENVMFKELSLTEMQNIEGGGLWKTIKKHVKSFFKGFDDGAHWWF